MKIEWNIYGEGTEVDLQLTAASPQEKVLLALLADRKVTLNFSTEAPDEPNTARLDIEFQTAD